MDQRNPISSEHSSLENRHHNPSSFASTLLYRLVPMIMCGEEVLITAITSVAVRPQNIANSLRRGSWEKQNKYNVTLSRNTKTAAEFLRSEWQVSFANRSVLCRCLSASVSEIGFPHPLSDASVSFFRTKGDRWADLLRALGPPPRPCQERDST
ncbi:hypothetical protein CEXT_473201 [Caerostris extrusa]|uniref:Uncharacterized protein n=1 Tax=Caerostris extrusa TaxID=172846 RepID=A0AAV4S4T3_CAEEX|nr:hypothetical protein CEXT_473201 [Caerostris extrusa]